MQEVRDGVRRAGSVEGKRELASDSCWRRMGVVKANKIEAGQRVEVLVFLRVFHNSYHQNILPIGSRLGLGCGVSQCSPPNSLLVKKAL